MPKAPPSNDCHRASQEPVEPQFWVRYSPHHEFPLSSVLAVSACGIVLGLLLVLEILHVARQDETARPPKMDAVEIEGGGGTDGPGGENTGPKLGKTEVAANNTRPNAISPPSSTPSPQFKDVDTPKVDVPKSDPKNTPDDTDIFAALRTDAEKQVQLSMDIAKEAASAPVNKGNPNGTPNGHNPGSGGGAGGGVGKGIGKAQGSGTGTSKFGQVLTQQQKHEMRWLIKFITDDGREHVEQLRAMKITLAVPTHQQGIFTVMDLTRTPPVGKIDNLAQQRDKVKWFNYSPPSLQRLAAALRLQQPPQFVVIFLPPEMEETLARLEREYRGLQEHQITMTEFEIRRRPDGSYVPEVTSQR